MAVADVERPRFPKLDMAVERVSCPIGHSDRPDRPARASAMKLWGEAKFHAAPLSRAAVEKIATERRVLSK